MLILKLCSIIRGAAAVALIQKRVAAATATAAMAAAAATNVPLF